METKMCVVCMSEGKVKSAERKIGRKNVFTRVALDVCAEHQEFFEDCSDIVEAVKKAEELRNKIASK